MVAEAWAEMPNSMPAESQGNIGGVRVRARQLVMTEQAENITRVCGAIGRDVLEFCSVATEFQMEQLREFVASRGHRAPDSAGRILRLLRQRGLVNYEVTNRRASRYRIVPVVQQAKTQKELF